MANRFRNERIEIKLTKEEKEVFEKKMKLANCKTMSHFLRKCVLEKEIYIVDLEPFRNLQWLLSNATNNINQIAKATNTTGIIYKNESEKTDEKVLVSSFKCHPSTAHIQFMKIRKIIFYSIF